MKKKKVTNATWNQTKLQRGRFSFLAAASREGRDAEGKKEEERDASKINGINNNKLDTPSELCPFFGQQRTFFPCVKKSHRT